MSWINVKDKLPENNCYCICCVNADKKTILIAGYHKKNNNWTITVSETLQVCMKDSISHWQPLPQPPKED